MNSNTVNPPIEFPSFLSYTGTKTIRAMPMGAAEAKRHGANITDEIVNKNLGNNGYLVEYPDGYRSWSPATQFEAAYRLAETHVDRMKIELADLKQRILKATDALYSPGRLTPSDRSMLETQVKAMQIYADVLFSRFNKAINEEKRELIRRAAPTTAEGGEQ